MFIELTDHLRCPSPHEEAFLVLLPDRMEDRRVVVGHLGCPFCSWSTSWTEGLVDFGGGRRLDGVPEFTASDAHAMLGLTGGGGWVALAGRAGLIAHDLSALMPNVGFVAVNPPPTVDDAGEVSVITSAVWPIKRHALRGALMGLDAREFLEPALASLLPGRHLIGEGEPLDAKLARPLAAAAGVWVAEAG